VTRDDNHRVKSVYLDKSEIEVIEEIAKENGQSANAVIRIAVRTLLGLPAVSIAVSDELRERFGLAPRSR
jgi:ribbon-helix-helix CopG family protein